MVSNFNFDHINITVGEDNKALAFFRDVLGFNKGYRPPFPFAGEWFYSGKQAMIHAITPNTANGRMDFGHVAFRGEEDAEAVIERIKSLNLNYRLTTVPESGEKQIFVDLDGLMVEIITPS